jgi:F-type H+-transporting ATPase subunit b
MATNSAHTQVPGAHKFPPLQTETYASQLFWLALVFILLYLLMSRIALPRVASIIEERNAHIQDDLAEAERLREESEAAIAAYEKALADARSRALALANETREREAKLAEAARKDLDARLQIRIAEAEKVIADRRTAAMANVKDIAVEAAAAIVERLIGAIPPRRQVDAAVDAALKS